MIRSVFAPVLTLTLLLASPLRAADLPVRYVVNSVALKSAVVGTNLTFQLFTDSACATTAVFSQVVAVENVQVLSQLKPIKPTNGVKPPKTAELIQTLTSVSGSGNLYLEVTGTGVTPIGGACQAQAAQVSPHGPMITATIKDFGFLAWEVVSGTTSDSSLDPYGDFSIVAAARSAATTLQSLDRTKTYICSLETGSATNSGGTIAYSGGGYVLPIFDLTNCVVAP